MSGQSSGFVLDLSCALPAPPELVFEKLTVEAELTRWWGPRGFTTPSAAVDLRVGGSYRFAMQPPDGDVFHLSGRYLEVDPPQRLAYTFTWEEPTPDDRETVVVLTLRSSGTGTEVGLTQGQFATEERLELHRAGWSESFERLRDLLAGA